MNNYICPCCDSNKISKFLLSKKFPYFTTPIKSIYKKKIKNKNYSKYFDDLRYYFCKKCEHVFLKKFPNQKIINELYEKYYNYPSAMLGEFLPTRDNTFINFLKKYLNKKINKQISIFEVGCYDGYILHNLKKLGFNKVAGCDPSNGAKIAKKFKLNVKKDFFNAKKIKTKYDIVIARHLVEHLENPLNFFKSLERITHHKSKIIIEVPNGEFYLNKGLLEVFSHQHIHLFNKFSMQSLIINSKLYIEKVYEKGANVYFVLTYKKNFIKINKSYLIKRFLKNYHNNLKKISNILHKNKNKKIICYGAGGFFCAAIHLYKIEKKDVFKILDSDKNKINKEYLHIDTKIQSNTCNIGNNTLIIITSYYTDEIFNLIKKKKISKNVMLIHPKIKHKILK